MQVPDSKIIVAVDSPVDTLARRLVSQLDPKLCRLKIGSVLFTHYGPALIEVFMKQGFSIFLDLKFHDIPQTVAGACRSAAALGVWMLNVHAQGGCSMIEAARNELEKVPKNQRPLLVAVTVLTSLDQSDLLAMGWQDSVESLVLRLALLAEKSGADGVVCSAHEACALRSATKKSFLLVTPGIRLSSGFAHDQKRVMTPREAIAAGANYLVIGRAITEAKDPLKQLELISAELHESRYCADS